MSDYIDEYGEVGDASSVKIPPQVKGKLEYHSTPATPTDNTEWLDEVLNDICWREMLTGEEFNQAKAQILTHIDTVCREQWTDGYHKGWQAGHTATKLNPQLNPNKDTV